MFLCLCVFPEVKQAGAATPTTKLRTSTKASKSTKVDQNRNQNMQKKSNGEMTHQAKSNIQHHTMQVSGFCTLQILTGRPVVGPRIVDCAVAMVWPGGEHATPDTMTITVRSSMMSKYDMYSKYFASLHLLAPPTAASAHPVKYLNALPWAPALRYVS